MLLTAALAAPFGQINAAQVRHSVGFDINKDPYERNNLAMNPEYAQVLTSCQKQLGDWRAQQSDNVPVKQPRSR